jgi:hypothetical protein
METQGAFGYIIDNKKRIMFVESDAELLWQILVREIYVLMKHYGSKEALRSAFENIKTAKGKPKNEELEKYIMFTNLHEETYSGVMNRRDYKWSTTLHYCQSSFINILEAGLIVNQAEELGFVFLLDFDKGCVKFYKKYLEKKREDIATATLEEIMEFDDMPIISREVIINEMKSSFNDFYGKYLNIREELQNLYKLKTKARRESAANIEDKVDKLIYDMEWEMKKLHAGRRVFYNRLKVLDLIEE